jgi:hypothetical protein
MKMPSCPSVSLANRTSHLVCGLAALVVVLGSAPTVRAELSIPYANVGTYNATTYSFTAMNSGDVVAYFAGSTASYENQLGLLVNGVQQGGFGLDNHSSAIGQSYDFGPVNAGDSLVFILHNLTLGADAYSNPSMNVAYDNGPASGTTDGHNHIYSTNWDGTNPGLGAAALAANHVPFGVFVAFEDLRYPGSDYNYNDETFVFTNVAVSSVPEPSSALVVALIGGLGGAGVVLRRRHSSRRPADAR